VIQAQHELHSLKKNSIPENEKNSSDIADAPQIFQKNFFFFFFIRKTSPGSEKKNFILKNLPADCNTFSKLNNQAKSIKIIPRNNKTLIYLIFRPE
jgi:hypothetical protein